MSELLVAQDTRLRHQRLKWCGIELSGEAGGFAWRGIKRAMVHPGCPLILKARHGGGRRLPVDLSVQPGLPSGLGLPSYLGSRRTWARSELRLPMGLGRV